jgi:hypothetical protein
MVGRTRDRGGAVGWILLLIWVAVGTGLGSAPGMDGRTGAQVHVRRSRRIAWLAAALLLVGWPALARADIVYHYDQLGRLRGMVTGTDTVIWTFDSVGNVLSVVTQPSSQVAIIEVRPRSGPVGTVVEILGAGFSPTPSQNAVTFNGVAAATPTSASPTTAPRTSG